MTTPLDELHTLRDWLRWAISRFNEAQLFFGHGTDNAHDEAAWLILHALHLPPDQLEPYLDARLTTPERRAILDLIQQRVSRRVPAAYLTHEAWLGDFRFYVDERVIVPRSYIAELLREGLQPWIDDPTAVASALDLCTGSGCLAVVMAYAFPEAAIDAVDISRAALDVARRNIDDYGLEEQVRPIESDLFAQLNDHRYDVIVSNPPYVTAEAMAALPEEFRHEPELALAAGDDGLDIVRRIIAEARKHLSANGVLIVEVGHNRNLVDDAFPELPLVWLDTEHAEAKVFLVHAADLP